MKNLDAFGKDVLLRYKGSTFNQTSIGGLLSLGILVAIVFRFKALVDQINNRSSPQLYSFSRSSQTSQTFNIAPNTFTLVVGVTGDSQTYQLINSSIFTLQAFMTVKNTSTSATQTVAVQLEQCISSHFQINGVSLDSSKYANQYCLSPNQQLQISGDYTSQSYTSLTVQLVRCSSSCADDQTITNFLKNNFVEVFFSDVYVQPTSSSLSPFNYYGRLLRFNNLSTQTKKNTIYLRNNRVDTDTGFIFTSISSENMPSYSSQDQQVFDYTLNTVNAVTFEYDQKLENYFSRSYEKLISVICDIGGLLCILKCLVSPICSFYAKADLCISLINKQFQFQEIKHSVKTSTDKEKTTPTPKLNYINNHEIEELSSEDKDSTNKMPITSILAHIPKKESMHIQSINDTRVKSILKQKDHQLFQSVNSADSIAVPIEGVKTEKDKNEELKQLLEQLKQYNQHMDQIERKKQQSVKKSSPSLNAKSKKERIIENIKTKQLVENIKKTQMQISTVLNRSSNSFEFSFSEYLKSYFFTNPKTKIIDHSVKQLDDTLDIQTILNKLNELDQLKKLLLNEDQLALFQFMPKTCMNYSIIDSEVVFHDTTMERAPPDHFEEDYEKLKKAIDSYKNIINQDRMKRVDTHLIQSIDPSYLNLFKELVDRKKSVTITENQKAAPSITFSKTPSVEQQQNAVLQKKPKKLHQLPPRATSPKESSQFLSAPQQQSQIHQLPEYILNKQIEAYHKRKNSLSTPQNSTVQLMIPSSSDNHELSNEFAFSIEQEIYSNREMISNTPINSLLEDNVKFHSSSGIIQKPYLSNDHENVFNVNKQ